MNERHYRVRSPIWNVLPTVLDRKTIFFSLYFKIMFIARNIIQTPAAKKKLNFITIE